MSSKTSRPPNFESLTLTVGKLYTYIAEYLAVKMTYRPTLFSKPPNVPEDNDNNIHVRYLSIE